MAYAAAGLVQIANGGAIGTGEGSVKRIFHYATNDADTVVEADGYFDNTDLNDGDLLVCSLDVDGTAEIKTYIVSVGTGDIDSNDVTIVAMLIA
tara:strand:- start:1313 stop:1594 length:282 start_codon:yes stop_codon:yes gene_type:complete